MINRPDQTSSRSGSTCFVAVQMAKSPAYASPIITLEYDCILSNIDLTTLSCFSRSDRERTGKDGCAGPMKLTSQAYLNRGRKNISGDKGFYQEQARSPRCAQRLPAGLLFANAGHSERWVAALMSMPSEQETDGTPHCPGEKGFSPRHGASSRSHVTNATRLSASSSTIPTRPKNRGPGCEAAACPILSVCSQDLWRSYWRRIRSICGSAQLVLFTSHLVQPAGHPPPRIAQRRYQPTFNPNWICRDVFVVRSIKPALETFEPTLTPPTRFD
jgi:hypothetical protein